jgi:hypothetical protein
MEGVQCAGPSNVHALIPPSLPHPRYPVPLNPVSLNSSLLIISPLILSAVLRDSVSLDPLPHLLPYLGASRIHDADVDAVNVTHNLEQHCNSNIIHTILENKGALHPIICTKNLSG